MTTPTHILVQSRTDGYRRAGFGFTKAGVVLALADLDESQAAALQADPRLTITPVVPDDGDGTTSDEANTTASPDGDAVNSATDADTPVEQPKTPSKTKKK